MDFTTSDLHLIFLAQFNCFYRVLIELFFILPSLTETFKKAYPFWIIVSWILLIFFFGVIYIFTPFTEKVPFESIEHTNGGSVETFDYFYFSAVTATTLGYGDFQPVGNGKVVALTEAIFGYIFLGISVALIYKLIEKAIEIDL